MSDFWNERYGHQEYVYGEEPNVFFAAQLQQLVPGTIILPCEGEGRNAVHAASKGWDVKAYDSSEAGRVKALQLALKRDVTIDYAIEDAVLVQYPESIAAVVAFIYAHFPPSTRKTIHQKAIKWLKPGGRIIIEAFHPKQLEKNSGGPRDVTMLYTEELMKADFSELTIEFIQTTQTVLQEGKYHQGNADVIRMIGVKK
jgi:hypothetical protein